MDRFEFYFSLLSLLLGLSLTQVAGGMASALKVRARITIGWLTPLAALLICLDIASFWPALWAMRGMVQISTWAVLIGIALCLLYYISASFAFPDAFDDGVMLDDWFMANRRFALGGTLIGSAIFFVIASMVQPRWASGAPWYEIVWGYRGWIVYAGCMAFAILTPGRRGAMVAMLAVVALYPLDPVLFQ